MSKKMRYVEFSGTLKYISVDFSVKIKESEKRDIYLDLARELRK